ncbi:hypothetical protein [Algoriphagus confluentis]|uniref:Uncharacterized protein n=1 Tax=Algoriphagus confluentis TaxID=1697556 RepID=A0ABQ6PRU1_9BACT|nr:hypothetical protein Aconfl_33670 [Algoriphagus confluentis]
MKNLFLFVFLLIGFPCVSQVKVQPGMEIFDAKWLTDRTWKMNMVMVSNGSSRELGIIQNDWRKKGGELEIITQVVLPGLPPQSWVDSLTVDWLTLAPIRHKSVNMQRDILINYGSKVDGYYLDKGTKVKTPFSYSVKEPVFDSGFYLSLFQLMFLESIDSPIEVNIFDFKPEGKQGVLKAFITNVEIGWHTSKTGEKIEVWIVESYDTIGNQNKTISYISKSTRNLIKQETLDNQGNGMILEIIYP